MKEISGSDHPCADIRSSAKGLLDRHGRDAVLVAAMQADDQLFEGDLDGYHKWKRVGLVLDELMSERV